ncbi:MAG TPA: glutamate racemase [Thermoanaerobaculia bacterium]|nr:glutamate racemase [Thermoanaerobaculia bacterium]
MNSAASRNSPIGVFDSGVGGLTVFREIARILPAEPIVYLGDSARVPYGNKSPQNVLRYTLEAAEHLVERGVKMLVIACNTATAAALPELMTRLQIPVLGVIEPGARAAAAITRGKVGIIATEGTVKSNAYRDAILAVDPGLTVFQSACPLFVPLAEEGWADTHVAREVAEIYLRPLLDDGIDTLVLGCTHYPLLRQTIEQITGAAISVVDSAETTALRVAQELSIRNLGVDVRGDGAQYRFLVTDAEERFRKIAGEFLESSVDHLELVQLG